MLLKISGNFREDSRGCSKWIWGMLLKISEMFKKISENVQKGSGECSRMFQGFFKKIPGIPQEDSRKSKFRFIMWILPCFFYQILLLNCCKSMEKNNYWTGILKKAFSSLVLITNLLKLITFSCPFLFFSCWGKYVILVEGTELSKNLNNPECRS